MATLSYTRVQGQPGYMRSCLINSNSPFAHLWFCLLKLVAAGPSQFAETMIFICEHIIKWQFIEHLIFIFYSHRGYFSVNHYWSTSLFWERYTDSLFQVTAPTSPFWTSFLAVRDYCYNLLMPVLCAISLRCGYWLFLSLFCKLIDGENDVSLLLMSPLSSTVPHRIITEELLGGWVSRGWIDTFTWLN